MPLLQDGPDKVGTPLATPADLSASDHYPLTIYGPRLSPCPAAD
jgi:hypothetical protein